MIQDVSTRWNSVYYMAERIASTFPAVYKVLNANNDTHLVLKADELTNLAALTEVLGKFEEVTRQISSEKKPTIGLVLPAIAQLMKVLSPRDSDPSLVKKSKALMRQDLDNRYGGQEVRRLLGIASALHPKFKMLAWLPSFERNVVYATVKDFAILSQVKESGVEAAEDDDGGVVVDEAANDDEENQDAFFDDDILNLSDDDEGILPEVPAPNHAIRVDTEIAMYRLERSGIADSDPLAWWLARRRKYRYLSIAAARIYCIPATSVPSERVFSTAGQIISNKRSRLTAENASMLIFLHENLKYYIDIDEEDMVE